MSDDEIKDLILVRCLSEPNKELNLNHIREIPEFAEETDNDGLIFILRDLENRRLIDLRVPKYAYNAFFQIKIELVEALRDSDTPFTDLLNKQGKQPEKENKMSNEQDKKSKQVYTIDDVRESIYKVIEASDSYTMNQDEIIQILTEGYQYEKSDILKAIDELEGYNIIKIDKILNKFKSNALIKNYNYFIKLLKAAEIREHGSVNKYIKYLKKKDSPTWWQKYGPLSGWVIAIVVVITAVVTLPPKCSNTPKELLNQELKDSIKSQIVPEDAIESDTTSVIYDSVNRTDTNNTELQPETIEDTTKAQ